jgi:hypothetical protein
VRAEALIDVVADVLAKELVILGEEGVTH